MKNSRFMGVKWSKFRIGKQRPRVNSVKRNTHSLQRKRKPSFFFAGIFIFIFGSLTAAAITNGPTEVIDLRTETSKTYKNSDSSFTLEEFTQPIHYMNNGGWEDIVNEFKEYGQDNYKFKNGANSFDLYVGNTIADGIWYQDDTHSCKFDFEGLQIGGEEAINLGATASYLEQENGTAKNIIVYKNASTDIDLEVELQNTGLRTEFVTENYDVLPEKITVDVTACEQDVFDDPIVTDDISIAEIPQELVDVGNEQKLELEPDYSQLGELEGEVRIDPSITDETLQVNVFTSQFAANGHTRRFLAAGAFYDYTINANFGTSEAYLRFSTDNVPNNAIINSATLRLRKYANSAGVNFTTNIGRLTQSISGNTGASTNDWRSHTGNFGSASVNTAANDFQSLNYNITSLYNSWRNNTYTNHGVAVYSPNLSGFRGMAVCSARSDTYCTSSYAPRLIISYDVNQAPNIPNVTHPSNNQTFGGTCDRSQVPEVGDCSGDYNTRLRATNIGDGDPSPGHYRRTYFHMTRNWYNGSGNPQTYPTNYAYTTSGSTLDNTRVLDDGRYTTYRARSQDWLGVYSNFSPSRTFTIDTTPPSTPALQSVSEFSSLGGFDIVSNTSIDNVIPAANIDYRLQYSTDSGFTNPVSTGWQSASGGQVEFQMGEYGADNTQGTADDFVDGQTYHFRVHARDDLGNISYNSASENTTIDGSIPVITDYSVDAQRFSPNNASSVGLNDDVTFTFEYLEDYGDSADIIIRNDVGNTVRTITQDLSGDNSSGSPASHGASSFAGNTNNVTGLITLVWDGRDDAGSHVAEGLYNASVQVTDKAGQVNSGLTATNNDPAPVIPILLVSDNTGSAVQITSPFNNVWTNQDNIDITGQIFVDDSTVTIAKEQDSAGGTINQHTCSDGGDPCHIDGTTNIFTYNTDIVPGANYFEVEATDSVSNVESEQRQINRENTAPMVSNVLVEGQSVASATQSTTNEYLETNNPQPSVTFEIADPEPTGDGAQQSQLQAVILPGTVDVKISYPYLDSGNPRTAEIPLFVDGINVEPTLVSDLVCAAQTGEAESTINGINSAAAVDCSFDFVSDLTTDSDYTIWVTANDNAGNSVEFPDESTFGDSSNPTRTELVVSTFSLDTTIHSVVNAPIDSGMYATDIIATSGQASRFAELTFNEQTTGETRTVTLDDALSGMGSEPDGAGQLFVSDFTVVCGTFIDADGDPETPDEEVCDWSVDIRAASVNSDTVTPNTLEITAADTAGNTLADTTNFDVNLYAFDLLVSSDFEYISPNGDGNQDGLTWSHTARNPNGSDPATQPTVINYETNVLTTEEVQLDVNGSTVTVPSGTTIRTIGYDNPLPATTPFDAQICADANGVDADGSDCDDSTAGFEWVYLPDSTYDYTLTVNTLSGASVTTSPNQIYSFTSLEDSVVITNPITGFITTSGVVNIQGQAPESTPAEGADLSGLRGDITVTLCVDMVVPPGSGEPEISCDFTGESLVDSNGFWTDIVVLPRLSGYPQTVNNVTAYASDQFGNTTSLSNVVTITTDTVDPFIDVSVTPALTGITEPSDYAEFLAGNIDINAIRSVILEANVSQNTEQVQFDFAEFTDASSLPSQDTTTNNGQFPYTYIATVNDDVETDSQLNPLSDPNRKLNHNLPLADPGIGLNTCSTASCIWQIPMPIAEPFGGIYEIQFTGKKGSTIESMTAGFEVDGDVPAAPLLMLIDGKDENPISSNFGVFQNIPTNNNAHYSNASEVRLRGAAEPGTVLEIYDAGVDPATLPGDVDVSGLTPLATVNVASTGVWEAEIDLVTEISNRAGATIGTNDVVLNAYEEFYLIGVTPAAGVDPQVQSTNFTHFVYDTVAPEIVSLVHDTATPNRVVNSSYASGFEEANSDGFLKSYEYADIYLVATEGLLQADILKEDNYSTQFDYLASSNLNSGGEEVVNSSFNTQITASRDTEGFYYPEIDIKDYAGNTLNIRTIGEDLNLTSGVVGNLNIDTVVLNESGEIGKHSVATNFENNQSSAQTRQLDDLRLYIDNSIPEPTEIDVEGILTGNWGDGLDGIFADKEYPEQGRTNPEYVVFNNEVVLTGVAEAGQTVEIFINNQHRETVQVAVDDSAGDLCATLDPDTIIDQGLGTPNLLEDNSEIVAAKGNLNTKSGTYCQWSYTYNFLTGNPDSGANTIDGVPIYNALFQVRTRDNSGNTADWSKTELVYHDTTNPNTPTVDNLPDLTNQTSFNLKFNTERESDTVVTIDRQVNTKPSENLTSWLYRSPPSTESIQTINLGSSPISARDDTRANCTTTDPTNQTRRIGICNDGLYQVSVTATDAAGNTSTIYTDSTVRDTTRPFTPTVSAGMSGLYTIVGSVQGETNSTSNLLGNLGNDGFASGVFKNLDLYNNADWQTTFTFCSTVTDPATNESLQDCASVTTPIRPPRPGECVPSQSMVDQIEKNIRNTGQPGFDGFSFGLSCTHYIGADVLQLSINDIVSQIQNILELEALYEKIEENRLEIGNCVNNYMSSYFYDDAIIPGSKAKVENNAITQCEKQFELELPDASQQGFIQAYDFNACYSNDRLDVGSLSDQVSPNGIADVYEKCANFAGIQFTEDDKWDFVSEDFSANYLPYYDAEYQQKTAEFNEWNSKNRFQQAASVTWDIIKIPSQITQGIADGIYNSIQRADNWYDIPGVLIQDSVSFVYEEVVVSTLGSVYNVLEAGAAKLVSTFSEIEYGELRDMIREDRLQVDNLGIFNDSVNEIFDSTDESLVWDTVNVLSLGVAAKGKLVVAPALSNISRASAVKVAKSWGDDFSKLLKSLGKPDFKPSLIKNNGGYVVNPFGSADTVVNKTIQIGDKTFVYNKNLFTNSNYTTDQYEAYIKRKVGEGKSFKNPQEYIEIRDHFLYDTKIQRGNNFNATARENRWYQYNEVHLENGKRLDSYTEGKEIVSRKATDLSEIQIETFERYLKEFKSKYPRGTKIRSNKYSKSIDGKLLEGDYILEIPNSNLEYEQIQKYIDLANENDITIRFRPE